MRATEFITEISRERLQSYLSGADQQVSRRLDRMSQARERLNRGYEIYDVNEPTRIIDRFTADTAQQARRHYADFIQNYSSDVDYEFGLRRGTGLAEGSLNEWQEADLYHVTYIPSMLQMWHNDTMGLGGDVSTTRNYNYALGYLKNFRNSGGVIFTLDQNRLRRDIGRRRMPGTDWFKGEPPADSSDEFRRRDDSLDTDRFETLIKGGLKPFRKYVKKIQIWLPKKRTIKPTPPGEDPLYRHTYTPGDDPDQHYDVSVNDELMQNNWFRNPTMKATWDAVLRDPRTEVKSELGFQKTQHNVPVRARTQYGTDHRLYDLSKDDFRESLKEFAPGGQGGNGPFDYGSAIVQIGEDYTELYNDDGDGADAARIIKVGKTFMDAGMTAGINAFYAMDTMVRDHVAEQLQDLGFNVRQDIYLPYRQGIAKKTADSNAKYATHQATPAGQEEARNKTVIKAVIVSGSKNYQPGDEVASLIFDKRKQDVAQRLAEIKKEMLERFGPKVKIDYQVTIGGNPVQVKEQGVAEGLDDDDPFELSSDYALHIANAGRMMITQLTNMSKKIQTDTAAAQNAKSWNLGDFMQQHYKTDDLNAINQVFEEYGTGGLFDQNLYELLVNWSLQGPEYATTWKQYSGDVIKNSTRKPGNQPVHEQGVAESRENFNGIDISMEIQKDDEYVDDEDYDNQVLYVTASSKGKELGHVLFAFDGEYLMPQDLEVEERYRGQGIAQIMYDYVKSKGYKIRRSGQQTDAGAGFWDKHKGPGQNVWEHGVVKNFADGKHPGRKELDPDVYEDLDNSIIARIARQIVPTIRAKQTPEGYVYLKTADGLSLVIGCNIADGSIDINIGSQPMETTSSGPHKGAITEIIQAVYAAAVKQYGIPGQPGTLSVDHDAGHGVWQHIAQKLGLQYDAHMVKENFADGKGPGRPGDSGRHGIPKHATMAELEKASHARGRKGQLARWQLNMRRGHKK